jgi:hypothetical protein
MSQFAEKREYLSFLISTLAAGNAYDDFTISATDFFHEMSGDNHLKGSYTRVNKAPLDKLVQESETKFAELGYNISQNGFEKELGQLAYDVCLNDETFAKSARSQIGRKTYIIELENQRRGRENTKTLERITNSREPVSAPWGQDLGDWGVLGLDKLSTIIFKANKKAHKHSFGENLLNLGKRMERTLFKALHIS